MSEDSRALVMGAFRTGAEAGRAVAELEEAGIAPEEIGVLMAEQARDDFVSIEKHSKAGEGAAAGGMVGGAVGALALGLTAASAVAIPGLGILAAGPIVAAVTGAGAGGAVGGSIGGLIGLGMTEYEAKFNSDVLQQGGVVVLIVSDDRDRRKTAKEILQERGVDVSTSAGGAAQL